MARDRPRRLPSAASVSATAALNWLSTADSTSGRASHGAIRAVMSKSVLSAPSAVPSPITGVATATKPT